MLIYASKSIELVIRRKKPYEKKLDASGEAIANILESKLTINLDFPHKIGFSVLGYVVSLCNFIAARKDYIFSNVFPKCLCFTASIFTHSLYKVSN